MTKSQFQLPNNIYANGHMTTTRTNTPSLHCYHCFPKPAFNHQHTSAYINLAARETVIIKTRILPYGETPGKAPSTHGEMRYKTHRPRRVMNKEANGAI